ncbi:MAG TPA: hypothetical protein P5210_01860, partial [Draconibacterium sp.]|nr:hypothetical protein [Draconibacterium sp.]
MVRSFSYTLLITWILLSVSCKTNFTATKTDAQNISVSENTLPVDSQLVEQYLPKKKILEKDMKGVKFSKRLYVIKHYILFGKLINAKKSLNKIMSTKNKILY